MISRMKRCFTTSMLTAFTLLHLSNMQRLSGDIIHVTAPSGEISSIGYPNTTPTGDVTWNITVNADHRIILQFLDFQLVESNPCTIDNFELYDGVFSASSKVGRWCWNSFDKLTNTTFTSESNIFLLRFLARPGYYRKGFKTNYSSIPKEASSTTVDDVQATTHNETTSAIKTHSMPITRKEGSPSTFVFSSSITVMSNSNPSTEPNLLNLETVHYIVASCGILVIAGLCCIGLCCCSFCRKGKNKTKDSDKSNHIEFKALAPVGSVHSSGTLHERTTSDSHSDSHQSGFTEDKKSARPKSLGLEYSSPTYAMPDKKKRKELVTNSNISQKNTEKKKYGSPNFSSDTLYATPHGGKPDNSGFEINVAYQSCDSEEETGSNMAQDIIEYTYVDNKNDSKDTSKAAPREEFDDVTYDVPEGEEGAEDGLVSNIAYQSFDVENEEFEEDVEMEINLAYQSCDSEEENIGKSDATYYYLDDKDSEKQEEQKDIVYESV